MQPSAQIIADSISPDGVRLTTMQVVMHRFVLAEFNTHRVFSRNSASSRAIPVAKQIERIQSDLALPVAWPAEQKGMQGGEALSNTYQIERRWALAAEQAVSSATRLMEAGLHKSVTNRLLEPFMWHTVVVTSTAWQNFFALRLDTDAQPEIRKAALCMKHAYDASKPHTLREDEWHIPYVGDDPSACEAIWNRVEGVDEQAFYALAAKVSAARCARTSYLTQDGVRDIDEDLRLYDRLVTDRLDKGISIHWSPLEHVATPWGWNRQEGCIHFGQEEHLAGIEDTFTCFPLDHLPRVGTLLGWRSLRTTVEATHNARTFA